MKITDIENSLDYLNRKVVEKIARLGTGTAAEIAEEHQSHISAFVHGRENFSYKRILNIAKKLFPGGEV